MTTCITPGCTGTADHTLRCDGCNDNLWSWQAAGRTLPWHEEPPRQWVEVATSDTSINSNLVQEGSQHVR